MNQYDEYTNYLTIISGTSNLTSPAYMEAAKEADTSPNKSLSHVKNFITSIESVYSKGGKDSKIAASKGNIKEFDAYEDIQTTLKFLRKNLSGVAMVSELSSILDSLEKFQPQYTDGYRSKVRLIQLEYESAVYLLVTGLSKAMAEGIEVVQNGESIKIQKRSIGTSGVICDVTKKLAKELSSTTHKDYLEALLKTKENKGSINKSKEDDSKKEDKKEEPKKEDKKETKKETKKEEPKKEEKKDDKKEDKKEKDDKEESKEIKESFIYIIEGTVSETVDLIDIMISNTEKIAAFGKRAILGIKNSLFGILPLIRSIIYLRYKKKADTIVNLEQQAKFIEENIEQLENMKTIDPAKKAEIIKKQKAIAEAYMKKAAKLKAQLIETEKDAKAAISKENPDIKDTSSKTDDFVLEGVSMEEMFGYHEDESGD